MNQTDESCIKSCGEYENWDSVSHLPFFMEDRDDQAARCVQLWDESNPDQEPTLDALVNALSIFEVQGIYKHNAIPYTYENSTTIFIAINGYYFNNHCFFMNVPFERVQQAIAKYLADNNFIQENIIRFTDH